MRKVSSSEPWALSYNTRNPTGAMMETLTLTPLHTARFNDFLKAMNFQGRLKYLHGQNKKGKDGTLLPPQLALFAIATPLQPPSILEIRTKNFIFRTKHKLDFTPIGCDAK